MTLAELKPGESATISSINSDYPGVVRLMVLGLIEGTEVQFKHSALGGDPLEITLFGASISMRREQARQFQVNALSHHNENAAL